jgi:hypothetical protein
LLRHGRLVHSRSGEGECGEGGSHRVAVSRSDLEKGSGKVFQPVLDDGPA